MNFEKLSRRDFLKKTTILAIAGSSITLFSGLVNANGLLYWLYTQQSEPCEIIREEILQLTNDDGQHWVYRCYTTSDPCARIIQCGTCFSIDPATGNLKRNDDGVIIIHDAYLACFLNRDLAHGVMCLEAVWPVP